MKLNFPNATAMRTHTQAAREFYHEEWMKQILKSLKKTIYSSSCRGDYNCVFTCELSFKFTKEDAEVIRNYLCEQGYDVTYGITAGEISYYISWRENND